MSEKFRLNYKTDEETFKKVKILKAHNYFENNSKALDYLVNKGFEVWENENKEKE